MVKGEVCLNLCLGKSPDQKLETYSYLKKIIPHERACCLLEYPDLIVSLHPTYRLRSLNMGRFGVQNVIIDKSTYPWCNKELSKVKGFSYYFETILNTH